MPDCGHSLDYRDKFNHGVSLGGVIVTVIPSPSQRICRR